MKKLYTIGANGTSPVILTGVLAANSVTDVIDIRRIPNHHFSNVQGRFLEALLKDKQKVRYHSIRALGKPGKRTRDVDLSVGLAKAREIIENVPVTCLLGSEPIEESNAWHRSRLIELLCAENSTSYTTHHLDGRALYKEITQSFGLHHGSNYDIKQMFEKLNTQYFKARYVQDDIVMIWEEMRRVRPRRLGYFRYPSVIALNPVLDQIEVPREIAEAVLYHEMLHLQLAHDGLPFGHTVEFFQKESLFKDYAKRFRFDFSEAFAALDAVDPE